jgi:hypothetical protein
MPKVRVSTLSRFPARRAFRLASAPSRAGQLILDANDRARRSALDGESVLEQVSNKTVTPMPP